MEELFGLSMDIIMFILLAVFLPVIAGVAVMAWRNRVMLKLGLRNIPRRKSQTVLIIVGIMMSTLIMAAAFGTGDSITSPSARTPSTPWAPSTRSSFQPAPPSPTPSAAPITSPSNATNS